MVTKIVWWTKLFVAIVLILTAIAIMANADEKLPFENLHVKQTLPEYCYAMPRPMFERWCIAQNNRAYQESQRLVDVARKRNPWRETYVQDQHYKARVTQKQSETVSPTKASMSGSQDTNYQGNNVQKVYRSNEVSGGPVVVLNPYADRPAIVLYNDGKAYVADPDKTLTDEEAARLLDNE